ncbi:MAG TPA: hypothetical protein GXZ87_05455 [Bacteroidales bacterium]|nr:hypothetical protein [Bacteroidales bacterium]
MRKFNKLWLSLALILGFSVQMTAQQNGVAVIPIYSTGDAPIFYYMENIGTAGNQPSGATSSQYNLLYAQKDNNQMAKFALIGDIPSDIASTNKLWSLQKVNNKLVYKNYNGRYLNHDNSNNPAKVTDAEPATNIYAEGYPAAEYQFKIRVSTQPSPSIAWYKSANGNYLDRYSDQGANSRNA